MAAKLKNLLTWCKIQCEGYSNVNMTNFTSSWKSGLAFCAIIHRFRPDLIEYDVLKENDTYGNSKLAFDTGLKLGIPALLDPEDMVVMTVPDKLCIITYVSQYYNYFHNKPQEGGPGVKGVLKRPSDNNILVQPPEKKAIASIHASKKGTLDDKCYKCHKKVYLLERHMTEGKVYHRQCAREMDRQSTLKRNQDVKSVLMNYDANKTFVEVVGVETKNDKGKSDAVKSITSYLNKFNNKDKFENSPTANTYLSSNDKLNLNANFAFQVSSPSVSEIKKSSPSSMLTKSSPSCETIPTISKTFNPTAISFGNLSVTLISETPQSTHLFNTRPNVANANTNIQNKTEETRIKCHNVEYSQVNKGMKTVMPTMSSSQANKQSLTTFRLNDHLMNITVPIIHNSKSKTSNPVTTNIRTCGSNISTTALSTRPTINSSSSTSFSTSTTFSFSKPICASISNKEIFSNKTKDSNLIRHQVAKEPTKDTKTEWQIEAERRQKVRNGVYVDPEFKYKYEQEEKLEDPIKTTEHKIQIKTIDMIKYLPTTQMTTTKQSTATQVTTTKQSTTTQVTTSKLSTTTQVTASKLSTTTQLTSIQSTTTIGICKLPVTSQLRLNPFDKPHIYEEIIMHPDDNISLPLSSSSSSSTLISVSSSSLPSIAGNLKDTVKSGVFLDGISSEILSKSVSITIKRDDIPQSPSFIKYDKYIKHTLRRKIFAEEPMSEEEIAGMLQELDEKLLQVENEGRILEEFIRSSDESVEDDDIMKKWLALVKQRTEFIRDETQLIYKKQQQELEKQHEELEYQFRCLLDIPDEMKTQFDKTCEEKILEELNKTVQIRNNIIDCIEIDRIRYLEEDSKFDELILKENLNKKKKNKKDKKEDKKKNKWDPNSKPHKKFSFQTKKKKVPTATLR